MTQLQITLIPLIVLGLLAFWKPNAILFMVTAGVALFVGFNWFDVNVNNLGMTIGILLVAFALYCIGLAFRMLFFKEEGDET